jgi:hypothetical protein
MFVDRVGSSTWDFEKVDGGRRGMFCWWTYCYRCLKEEKAREEESETEVLRRRELRKSLNRRVSFASHATIRYNPYPVNKVD